VAKFYVDRLRELGDLALKKKTKKTRKKETSAAKHKTLGITLPGGVNSNVRTTNSSS